MILGPRTAQVPRIKLSYVQNRLGFEKAFKLLHFNGQVQGVSGASNCIRRDVFAFNVLMS